MKFTHSFGEFTHPFPQSYWNFPFSLQSIIHIEIYAVLWLAKSVTIYAFFVCKIFGTKIQSCKIFEEFQVWKYFIFFSSIGRWWWSAPASLGKRWSSRHLSSKVPKITQCRCKEKKNLGRQSELIFLNLNLDGSRRSYLHPEGLGGQEFQFTPKVDDYSENTQVQLFLHPKCKSYILWKQKHRIILSHLLFWIFSQSVELRGAQHRRQQLGCWKFYRCRRRVPTSGKWGGYTLTIAAKNAMYENTKDHP